MASQDGVDQLPQLTAAQDDHSPPQSFDEKTGHVKLEKRLSSDSSLGSGDKVESYGKTEYDEEHQVRFVNGEPVITTGWDVSRYLIDMRDDGDPALTFRSLLLGTVFAGLGAALCQVRPLLRCDFHSAD